MPEYGTELMAVFLGNTWPSFDTQPSILVTWKDVVRVFFAGAGPVRATAENTGRIWSASAVERLDAKLMEHARRGRYDGWADLDPEPAEELWRRWEYAALAVELHRLAGNDLGILVPRDAPEVLQDKAVALYMLGGPARHYRHRRFRPH